MLTIGELKEKHKGEQLAIEIRKEDITGLLEGEIVYHSRDRDEVWEKIKGDKRRLYVPYAGPLIKEGYGTTFLTRGTEQLHYCLKVCY